MISEHLGEIASFGWEWKKGNNKKNKYTNEYEKMAI